MSEGMTEGEGPTYATEMTSPEFDEAVRERRLFILPYGAMEEHGPHLPLGTDTIQPREVCDELARRFNAVVLPFVHYGLCSSTANFPGTITITFDTLRALTKDLLCELARHGVRDVLVLSGHAGRTHMAALKVAAEDMMHRAPEDALRVMVLSDYDVAYALPEGEVPPGDGHAGDMETSRVLAIRPELVKGTGPATTPTLPRFMVLPHPERHFPTGVMGDPTNASAKKGRRYTALILDELEKLIRENFGLEQSGD